MAKSIEVGVTMVAMLVTRGAPLGPAPRTTIPRPTSVAAKAATVDDSPVDPACMAPPDPLVPPGPAPITWTYLPTSAGLNVPDGEVRVVEPIVIVPSVLRIPSAIAPKLPTVTVELAGKEGVIVSVVLAIFVVSAALVATTVTVF